MPVLKEAAVLVAGQVMDIENLKNFQTKEYDGKRVVVATTDGFASVKLSVDEAAANPVEHFSSVAWLVRYGAWAKGEGNAQTTCRFVAPVNENDLDRYASLASSLASKK